MADHHVDTCSGLQNSLEALRTALDAVSEPVLIVHLPARRIVEANPPACKVVGLARSKVLAGDAVEVLGRLGLGHLLPDADVRPTTELRSGTGPASGPAPTASSEWTVLESPGPGGECLVLIGRRLRPECPGRGKPIARDAASQRVDPLTGLPDRAAFEDHLALRCPPADGEAPEVAVLFIDLDGFKAVNDRLGHRRGDELLRDLAQRLLRAVRPGDLVARFGGDEFTVLLSGLCSAAAATGVAQRLLAAAEDARLAGSDAPAVSISVGIAMGRAGMAPDALIDAADRAMYRAKAAGGGAWAVAEEIT